MLEPSTNRYDEQIARLQVELAMLKQENTELRASLNEEARLTQLEACQLKQTQSTEATPLVALAKSEEIVHKPEKSPQERFAGLAMVNEELRQRDRILETTTTAANALLTISDIELAISNALRVLGEGTGQDRVYIFENMIDPTTGELLFNMPYEWNAPGIPTTAEMGMHLPIPVSAFPAHLTEPLLQGQTVQFLTRNLDGVALELNEVGKAKSLVAVPIFLAGQWWGLIGFDDCHTERIWREPEISVLQMAAACVGSSIERDRTQQALLQLEQERVTELAKINAALEVEVIARSQAEQLARGQTEALFKILAGLAAEPNLDSFLGNALRAIAEQLGEQSAGLWVYDNSHDATILHLNYESGTVHWGAQTNRPTASIHCPLKGWDVEYLATLRQQKVLIHTEQEFAQSPGYATSRSSYSDRGIKTVLYVSLFFGDRFLGFITIRSTQTRYYQFEEVELARVLAYQVALAIQLTQLAKQAQQSAVLEERNRLARDIHDTLAQVLTGVIVQLQAAENPYTTDPQDRQEHLAQAHLLAKQGLSEARRSIRALRSQILEATDFVSALTDLTEQMTIGAELQVNCQIEGIPYWLEPDMESHLFRIAQEAMTNTFKHAQASTLHLKLVYEPSQVQLQVADNGQGVDPTITSVSGYGVIGMQERSQQIGAQFRLTSCVGQGTIVRVIVPISTPASTRSP